jgi:sulfatase maturation enzyme AslB (radical SAM superfamily)
MIDPYARQPREVSIETLALCNAACTFCPYPSLARKGAKMSMDLITHLIGQMRTWTEPFFISPFKVNEPLLDVRLSEICAGIIAEVPAARLRLFTNGQPLTQRHTDWIQGLPVGRLEHLWVSLNSTDAQEYGELMKCSYSIVSQNLDSLHHRVAIGAFRHPVVLSRVVQGNPGEETSSVLSDRDLRFHRQCLARWPRFHTQLIKRDAWLGHVQPSDPRVPATVCGRWWELSITAQGKAVLCCMDGKGEYVQGDVTQQSLLDIYNSGHAALRRAAKTREGITPCQSCSY